MFRIYVERKAGFENEAARIKSEINGFLGISGVNGVRYFNRYDVENVADAVAKVAATRIFSEPQSDFVTFEELEVPAGNQVIVWEFLPGQYDQRADSAEQCLSLLREGMKSETTVGTEPPRVRCAKVVLLEGNISKDELLKIQSYLINPVDSRLTDSTKPATLKMDAMNPADIPTVEGFNAMDEAKLDSYRKELGLAMDLLDIKFLQDYFKSINRDPTITEIRVLDTYWSDHCRHTTFLTNLDEVKIADGPYASLFKKSYENYTAMRTDLYVGRKDKPVTLMDMACIAAKYLRKNNKLDDIEVSAEINACSVFVDLHYTTDANGNPIDENSPEATERWLLQFKNETHNHPTEIEPFGGAATCLGGAIRDPLSGRSWVYQSMRITGAADPTVSLAETLKGKLPQIKICREAAQGFSSYGNQIGLTTGQVQEIYHPGYVAKRMELGAVISASPADQVLREEPDAGDVVILLGGGTGRDGIGGATGSSKVHTTKSVTTAAAEVQKGNAVEERKIQKLFRNKEVCKMIRRCNDFGAGGVSVAIGELAPGLEINLDKVPKKYDGLDGTELAISESQERMACVVRKGDVEKFIKATNDENLNAVVVAEVTDTDKLVMKWRGKTIVELDRSFLDAAGAEHHAVAEIESPAPQTESPLVKPLDSVAEVLKEYDAASEAIDSDKLEEAWLANMNDLACCSQRGLGERFDGSIGSGSVLFPYGGKYQGTPEAGMAAKFPVLSPRETSTVSLMSYGFDPRVSNWSPWHGAQTAVLSSLAKIACMGGKPESCRLTFQEFFGRAVSEKTWGYPAAALLGSIDAQKAMGTPSIGGKDSMSGTFEDINVPHTLVSFAVDTENVKNVTSGSFKKSGNGVYIVTVPYDGQMAPDFETFKKNAKALYKLNSADKIEAMYPVSSGGIAEAVSKMALGNRVGCALETIPASATGVGIEKAASIEDLFTPQYGSIIVETAEDLEANKDFAEGTVCRIGSTTAEETITFDDAVIELSEIESAWEAKLAKVYPPVSDKAEQPALPEWALKEHDSLVEARTRIKADTELAEVQGPVIFEPGKAKPLVVLPVFPGTNCELDMQRAFNLAGARTKLVPIRNKLPGQLEETLGNLEAELKNAQILALSGGFSAGDEPDGSAKFIVNVLRNKKIEDQVMDLLKNRDGLVLGICNGFQALVKTGLAMYGEFRDMTGEMPTLTYNTIGRHISRIVRTRMVSAMSPWALDKSVLDPKTHMTAISHGEGRFVVDAATAEKLFKNGQVFTQYVDEKGVPSICEPDNPNGSLFAIEGITSPDGRVLGKMGHNERSVGINADGSSSDLFMNVGGDKNQNVFRAGVRYFK